MDQLLLDALKGSMPEGLGDRSRYYKGFLYGEYGVGKTVVSARCAMNKCLDVATDTGTDSFYNHQDDFGLVDKVSVMPYDGLSQLKAIGEAYKEGIEPWEDSGIYLAEHDLVLVDTVSQIQEEYLDFLNDNYTFKGDHRVKAEVRGGQLAAKRLGLTDQEIIGLPDYHLTRNMMRSPIKALIKAPVNVIFIAHLREPSFLEQQKGKIVRRPTLTESVFKLIAREASWMGLMEREGNKRTIQFETNKTTVAKSRIKEIENKKINADDLPEILQKWSNG